MRDVWFISDTHFGHENVISHSGRPFSCADEMDATMADNWSKNVKKQDLIYHLGDIAWTSKGLSLFQSLPGTKRLIIGNHDSGTKVAPMVQRLQLFRRFSEFGFMASHMPIPIENRREEFSVHGHIHQHQTDDDKQINICVEHTNYRPIHLDELLSKFNQ